MPAAAVAVAVAVSIAPPTIAPPTITIEEAWGFGISKVKEAIMGLKGDHEQWKGWRDEFKANL